VDKIRLRSGKFLPALIFALISIICIMAGWLIGTLTAGNHPSAYEGVKGGVLGLIIGSILGFSSFGFVIGWAWRKKYPNFQNKHLILLVFGWMFTPVIMFIIYIISIIIRR